MAAVTAAGEIGTDGEDRVEAGVHSLGDFDAACRAVLARLRAEVGMGLWFVSRTVGEDYVLLHLDGGAFGLAEGTVMRWADSLCCRVVDGAPGIVPRLASSPLHDGSASAAMLGVAAYIGIPLYLPNGDLFGTLGAIDPEEQTDELHRHRPMIELFGALLMTVLDTELRVEAEQRRAEGEHDAARTDALCGIPNRRAWNDAIEREEARCRRYGEPAGVIIIDLDRLKTVNDDRGHAAGDALLRRAARVLGSMVRESDLVARLGGDEFGVLAPGASTDELVALVARISTALQDAEVAASVGARSRRADMSLLETWHEADREMYRNKAELAVERGR